MDDQAPIAFRKMNGLGNDFVVIDARERAVALSADAVRRIADRDAGVGCDQLIVIERALRADALMRIYNADGGEVEACGNATRCVAMLLAQESEHADIDIKTSAGLLECRVHDDGTVTVDMDAPRFDWRDIPLAEEFRDTRAIELQIGPIDAPVLHSPSVVNVGNPHCIFWVDDVEAHDLEAAGPMLENHPIFPERANISLAHVASREAIRLRTWERGVGLTRACGTAACATVACAVRRKLTERTVIVTLPGGDLEIEMREDDDHLLMTGPVALDFDGLLDPAFFEGGAV